MKLYDYAFSSAAYRARIALNLKGLSYERAVISLIKDGGQQHSAAYKTINPQGLIPTLEDGGHVIGQSLAIVEYLAAAVAELSGGKGARSPDCVRNRVRHSSAQQHARSGASEDAGACRR
jgi:glutathione S-transferase